MLAKNGNGEIAGTETAEEAGSEDGYVDGTGTYVKRNRTEGYIIECDGENAVIAADAGKNAAASSDYWAVGQMISVRVGENRLVGLIYRVDTPSKVWSADEMNVVHIHIELVGEVRVGEDGVARFSNGIQGYPHMGAIAHRIRAADLAAIYVSETENAVSIGTLSQDASIPALINVDKLLARHFGVVGTTGVGKSTAVSLLLRKIVKERPDVRVLILDPHAEFATSFSEHAIVVDANKLDLPFWVFKFEELIEVIYRGRPPIPGEVDVLRDLIPLAKERFKRGDGTTSATLLKRDREATSLTADTPVPYRMADLIALIDDRIGQLEGKADRPHLKALRNRLDSLINDPRFRFMFGNKTIGDTLAETLSHVFRIPQNGKPICVFEMSNLPSEVVNAVASVLCRMAFDLALSSDGAVQTLVVCEEAHRYIPADPNAGFWPTRQAIARIAKEGRKYGVYLGVVTQRPGELDQTILSQCNTIFAMRLGNERDQDIIRKAITGAARSTTTFLSSIANRECIAFGEAFHTPMRMLFETIAAEDLPGAHIYEQQKRVKSGEIDVSVHDVIRRMREGAVTASSEEEDALDEIAAPQPQPEPAKPAPPQSSAPPAKPAPTRPAGPAVWTPDPALGRDGALQAAGDAPAAAKPARPPAAAQQSAPAAPSRRFQAALDTQATPAESKSSASNLVRGFRSR